MNEGDPVATSSRPGNLIDQSISGSRCRSEGLVQIGDPVADMVNAGAPPGEESGDGAVGSLGFEQLHVRLAEGKRDDASSVGPLRMSWSEAENVAIEGQRSLDTFDGYADMSDTRAVGHRSAAE